MALDYKSSGVDVEAGYKSVELMKQYVKGTMRPEVLGGLGGFSGAFSLAKIKEMEESSNVTEFVIQQNLETHQIDVSLSMTISPRQKQIGFHN